MLRFVQTALVLMVMSHQTVLGQLNLVTFANQVLAQHNFRRAQHCTPLVALNATLTAMAQNRSNINAANNAMAFSGGVGENLYKMMSSAPFTVINGSVPVEAFYQGISNYSFSAPGFTSGSGQFSQMIWKASTQIGVGIAFTNGNKTVYITINYWTPGNYANQFAANVLPVCAGGTTAAPAPTTTAAPTTTIAPTAALIAFQNQALAHHNFLRGKHCTAALTLVASLNTMAQNYANYLAANNLFQHGNASSLGYGENLWKAWQSVPFVSVNGSIPSQAWYDEIQLYNYATPSFNASTGHFTQLVWASTTQVGFGLAYSADKLTAVAVANYYSHGNVGGQFPANVKVLC